MRAIIDQAELNKQLGLVGRMVATRGQLPILANVLIEVVEKQIIMSATNLEIGVRINLEGKGEEEGAVSIPAKALSEFVGVLSGREVILESEGEKLKVECGRNKGNFAGIQASEFPVIPKFEEKNAIKINRKLIQEAATEVAFAAATDESRPVLTGVQFKAEEGNLWVTATDGFRLGRKKLLIAGNIPGLEKGLILPARTINELSRIASEGRKEEILMEVINENNQVIFGYDGIQFISRILEGNFPDMGKILPTEYKTQVWVDKEEFTRATKGVSIFARENSNIIRLEIKESELEIDASGQQTGEGAASLEAQTEGDKGTIAFNFRYILDFLSNIKGERVIIKLNGNLAPGVFGIEGNENLLHVVMPVRL